MKCPRREEIGALEDNGPFKLPDEDHWNEEDDTCSFCGSLNPDVFIKLVEGGCKLTPTDKNYKAYLDPHRKFYFQHLSKDQRKHFVKLMNDKAINFGHPGHFYKMPFFVVPSGRY